LCAFIKNIDTIIESKLDPEFPINNLPDTLRNKINNMQIINDIKPGSFASPP
jgi:hypothetical protein